MRRLVQISAVGLFGLAVIGCGGGSSQAPVAKKAAAKDSAAPATEATPQDPIASVAREFLEAVVEGDTPRATSLLTPDAIAQFAASQQGFASPEIGAPDFRVGQVRQVADDKAAVQCHLSDGEGEAEMCCLLRRVAGEWRVSGVAYETAAGQPPVILNFEAPEPMPQPSQATKQFAQQPAAQAPAARTASEAATPALR